MLYGGEQLLITPQEKTFAGAKFVIGRALLNRDRTNRSSTQWFQEDGKKVEQSRRLYIASEQSIIRPSGFAWPLTQSATKRRQLLGECRTMLHVSDYVDLLEPSFSALAFDFVDDFADVYRFGDRELGHFLEPGGHAAVNGPRLVGESVLVSVTPGPSLVGN